MRLTILTKPNFHFVGIKVHLMTLKSSPLMLAAEGVKSVNLFVTPGRASPSPKGAPARSLARPHSTFPGGVRHKRLINNAG